MRKTVLTIVKLVVSAGLLYFALRGVEMGSVAARLRQLDPAWATAAVAACLAQVCIAALRWREIVRACDGRISIADALRFSLVGTFFNQALPSTVGGDGMRLLLLQRTGVTWRSSTYSVLVDRAVGLIVLAVIVVVSLPWSYSLIANEQGRIALLLVDFVAIGGCVAFLIFGRLSAGWFDRWFAVRHIQACARITNKVLLEPSLAPKIILASLANHILTITIAWCAARAIFAPLMFEQAFLLIPPVVLIMTVPISIAGWGVREQSMQLAFLYAGLNGADGVTISILFGAVYLTVGIIGGATWLLSGEKASIDSEAEATSHKA
jgi:glycosyltransferase 2 family protein